MSYTYEVTIQEKIQLNLKTLLYIDLPKELMDKLNWKKGERLVWEKQKRLLGGPYCAYTGVKLTTERNNGKGYIGSTNTNISIDRIDPRLPYQEDNIVFCSWEFNDRKSGVTPEDCKKILKVHKERHAGN